MFEIQKKANDQWGTVDTIRVFTPALTQLNGLIKENNGDFRMVETAARLLAEKTDRMKCKYCEGRGYNQASNKKCTECEGLGKLYFKIYEFAQK